MLDVEDCWPRGDLWNSQNTLPDLHALLCRCHVFKNMVRRDIWELPKIGDPNVVPSIVGSLLPGPQNKVPLFSKTPIFGFRKIRVRTEALYETVLIYSRPPQIPADLPTRAPFNSELCRSLCIFDGEQNCNMRNARRCNGEACCCLRTGTDALHHQLLQVRPGVREFDLTMQSTTTYLGKLLFDSSGTTISTTGHCYLDLHCYCRSFVNIDASAISK